MDKEISLVVFIKVQAGKRDLQIEAFNKVLPHVLAEKGCIQYDLKAFQDDENKFAIIERWASEEDLAAHAASAHMEEAMANNHLFRAKPVELIKLVNT